MHLSQIEQYQLVGADAVSDWSRRGYKMYGNPILNQCAGKIEIFQVMIKEVHCVALEDQALPFSLTHVERLCLRGLIDERSLKEMAAQENCSVRAISYRVAELRKKFRCKTNCGVVSAAYELGFVKPGKVLL